MPICRLYDEHRKSSISRLIRKDHHTSWDDATMTSDTMGEKVQ